MEAQETREEVLKGILRRETEWLKAGVKARTTKQQARIQKHAELSKELSTVAKRNIKRDLQIDFQSSGDKPKRLLEVKHLSKSYEDGRVLFERLDLLLTPGVCLGILGENGCGKSSLIRVLLKTEKPTQGSVFHTDLLKVAYFEQGKEKLNPELSLIRSVCPYGDQVYYRGQHIHVRSYLQKFLFDQDKMEMSVGQLSGGEQSRIILAKLMLIEANLLVLDEPTNDLDIATLNVLEDCLAEFDGAIILVTHDRFFLDRVSTQLLAFPPKDADIRPRELKTFASFEQWRQWFKSFEDQKSSKVATTVTVVKPKQSFSSKEQQKIMKKIEKREAEYQKLEQECSDPKIASNVEELSKKGSRMSEIQNEIASLYVEWEGLESS